MDTNTLGYIIGGSVGGFVVLVIVVAVIIYCTCGNRRKSKRGEKKFRPLASESGRQSQTSTLSHIDPRSLPKVGNGLWVEAPAVYQVAPNQGLYYGRPNPKYRVEPGVQRSTSELRLQGSPPSHAVYQGNVRIYHSQQLAPVYEVVDTSRAPGIISVYEYNDLNQSTSRLISRNSAERQHRDSKKVKRSQSDISGRHKDKRDSSKRHSSQHSSHSSSDKLHGEHHRDRREHQQHSRPSSSSSSSHVKGNHKVQPMETPKEAGYDNRAFEIHHEPYTITTTLGPVAATDSMKLQDKRGKETNPLYNKTDDEKQVPKPDAQHYVYDGSVYAVPNKIKSDVKSENPIVELMDAMILERTESDSKRASSSSSHVRSTSATEVTSSVPVSVKDTTSIRIERTHPDTGESIDTVDASIHPPLSATQSEDMGPTGNQVTSEAFQFLDKYLGSDDEGPDSPPLSPGPGRLHTGF